MVLARRPGGCAPRSDRHVLITPSPGGVSTFRSREKADPAFPLPTADGPWYGERRGRITIRARLCVDVVGTVQCTSFCGRPLCRPLLRGEDAADRKIPEEPRPQVRPPSSGGRLPGGESPGLGPRRFGRRGDGCRPRRDGAPSPLPRGLCRPFDEHRNGPGNGPEAHSRGERPHLLSPRHPRRRPEGDRPGESGDLRPLRD